MTDPLKVADVNLEELSVLELQICRPLSGPPHPGFDAGPLMTVAEVLYTTRSNKGTINTNHSSSLLVLHRSS